MQKKLLFFSSLFVLLTGCGNNHTPADTTFTKNLPIDSNIELGNEKNVLYYVDPRPEEGGNNRALRINYSTMEYEELPTYGNNPHSIDRAGKGDKFYIRTQNVYSFDVVNFKAQTVNTVDLGDHAPRAIGAYNGKYNIQILSALNMPVVDVIDVSTDSIIATLGDRQAHDPSTITSNAGGKSATGHALWFDEDHFGLVDRVNKQIVVYRVIKTDQNLSFEKTSSLTFPTALHAIEKVKNPVYGNDRFTFYALGEGDLTINQPPFVTQLHFNPQTGRLSVSASVNFSQSNQVINGIKPTTHHAGISPDGKFLMVPVFDGKVYVVDRTTLQIVKIIEAQLGAAHIEFSSSQNIAIITNHFSKALTIIDMHTLSVKKHLTISQHDFDPNTKHLLQPHFSYVSKNGKYFYTFATQDGEFLKINLQTLEIEERLHTGGAPEQAHS